MIQEHKDPIESQIEGQVSTFHFKKVQEKKLDRDDLMFKAYGTAYWLDKEKVWNPILSSLADLPTLPNLHEMKNLQKEGTILDSNRSFNDHIYTLSSSLLSVLCQINRVWHLSSREVLHTVLNSLAFNKQYSSHTGTLWPPLWTSKFHNS